MVKKLKKIEDLLYFLIFHSVNKELMVENKDIEILKELEKRGYFKIKEIK